MTIRAYKYRFYPTEEIIHFLNKTFGSCRFVYNHFLDEQQKAYKETKKGFSYAKAARELPLLKKEYPWLKEVSSVALQQSLIHLKKAFQGFYEKRARLPRHKKKRETQSAAFMKNAFHYENGKLTLAKTDEALDVRYTRSFKGEPSSITISKTSTGKYYVSFVVEEEVLPKPLAIQTIGVDLGLTHAFVTSEGKKQEPCKALNKSMKKLQQRQKKLSKKTKGSANRTKAKKKVAILHEKVSNQRIDAIHKMTTALVNENQVICTETLSVKNMMRNRKLAKGISDAGWGTFVRCLEYKADWCGRQLVQIDRFFPSSKLCHHCKSEYHSLSLKEREWHCQTCQAFHDRDVNAARNIKSEGMRLMSENTVGLTGIKV